MPLTRREFNKSAVLYPVVASVASAGLLSSEKAEAMNLSVFVPDIASFLWVTAGVCCFWCPNKLVVAHFMPVALMEVISGGDSVLGVSLGLTPIQIGNYDEEEMSSHVRIWELNHSVAGLMFAGQGCKLCDWDYAKLYGILDFEKIKDWLSGDGMPSWMSQACNVGADAASSIGDFIEDLATDWLGECVPKLLYSTEIDFGWLTGCRDWLNWSSYSAPTCETVKTGADCMGPLWGALYPRQRTVIAPSPTLGAAILAYKALHTYANDLGYFPYMTDIRFCRMSMLLPGIVPAGSVGGAYLTAALKNYPVVPIPGTEMKYAFIWWVPVVCCKSISEVMGVCVPTLCLA